MPVPYPGQSKTEGGKVYAWTPPTQARDAFNYLGPNSGYQTLEDATAADNASEQGSWAPADYNNPNGINPWGVIGKMALAGAGGQALVSSGIPALAGLFSGGGGAAAAAPVAAATSASAAAPAAAGGSVGLLSGLTGGTLLNAGVNIGTGLLNGYSQGKQNDKQLAQQNAQFLASQAQNQKQFDAAQNQTQANQALNATQIDPFTQQKDRQKQALVAQLLQNYTPVTYSNGHYTGGLNNLTDTFKNIGSFFGPDAMASQEQSFNASAAPATGGKFSAPALGSVGYQGASANTPLPASKVANAGGFATSAPLGTAAKAAPLTGGSTSSDASSPLASMLGMQQSTTGQPSTASQTAPYSAYDPMASAYINPGALPDTVGMPSTSAQAPTQLAQAGQTPAAPTDQPNLMALIAKLTGKTA